MLTIAHRGASGYAPENTLAAFRRAVAMGASFIETDLHLSRDAHFVAIHDSTLERTTNGRGAVHDHTLDELRRLDAGSWFSSDFVGERIPTLAEVLEFARRHDIVFYLELKQSGAWGTEHGLVHALRQSGEIARAVVMSFEPRVLETLRHSEATLMTALLYDGNFEHPIERGVAAGVRQLAIRGDLVTPLLLEQARQSDLQVVCWTVNHPVHMRALISAGAHGIITDYPDRALAAAKEKRVSGASAASS